MDIVLSKNGVKCAVFEISDVQICIYVFAVQNFIIKYHYLKIVFWVIKNHLNLCVFVVNSKWLLSLGKTGVK